MSKELIERLRKIHAGPADTAHEAADRIEELERAVEFQKKAWTADLAENDALLAHIAHLRDALEEIGDTACGEASHQYIALTAIATTPEQSLAEYRNKVIEQMIACYSPDDSAHDYFDKLNAMKEPE